MKRPRTRLASGIVLLVALVAGVVVWAASDSGVSPASVGASAGSCARRPSVSNAPVPAALAAALPVLARPHTAQDGAPHEAISMLSSLATGIELDRAQLIGTSSQGGRSWMIPVLHESPQVASIACLKRELRNLERYAHKGLYPQLLARERRYAAVTEQYLHTHTASPPPGVIVFTQGQIVQGADGTLTAIQHGSAFTTGECAGPGHNLLTVSGLAPAATSTIQLHSPDGATQTQPAGDGAYSFLFAPSPNPAGLPDRLVLLNGGHRIATLTIPGGSFSTHPQCTTGATHGPSSEPSKVISAGFTVIAANPHGPDGVGYTIGVASGGSPACDPELNVETTSGSLGGGTRLCNLSLTAYSPVPTFDSAGCGTNRVELNGSVSSTVKRLRFIAADGQSASTPVFAAPPAIASGYGVILAVGPADVLGANPTIESLGANGRVLATSHALQQFTSCGKHYPVHQLSPGTVTLAHAGTPQGPVAILLHRIRFMGHVSLCISQRPQGNEQCATYPIGPHSNQEIGNAPIWLMSGGRGSCTAPRYQVITGIVLRPGLTPWLRTPEGQSRMPTVPVPQGFHEPGPLFYAVLTKTPDTIVIEDAAGKTVYSTPAVTPTPSGSCGGLNPDTSN
jgi:hypothetical protein